jgi:hypothetical protein
MDNWVIFYIEGVEKPADGKKIRAASNALKSARFKGSQIELVEELKKYNWVTEVRRIYD